METDFTRHAAEAMAGVSFPVDPSLQALLTRLDGLSREPAFAPQRRLALERYLRPYVESSANLPSPLPEEESLALLTLYADFYPEDGQLTLVEQLRDVVTEHVPDEERRWLDPLKHSHMDLLEVLSERPGGLSLRSLGDGAPVALRGGVPGQALKPGDALLTRIIGELEGSTEENVRLAGTALLLPMQPALTLMEASREWERSMEITSGSFALGEWREFVKRYGYVLLWNAAALRLTALVEAVEHIRYRTPDGAPYLYALALYDHHAYRMLAEGLSALAEFEADTRPPSTPGAPESTAPTRVWVQRGSGGGATGPAARLTLSSVQLFVECDSPDRLNTVKHLVASSFGYSVRFRGESVSPPDHRISPNRLTKESDISVVVTAEEQLGILRRFLETAYLEWSDQPSAALEGQTPRHAAGRPALRRKVAGLIDELERQDPGLRLIGTSAFDYGSLRNHVGL